MYVLWVCACVHVSERPKVMWEVFLKISSAYLKQGYLAEPRVDKKPIWLNRLAPGIPMSVCEVLGLDACHVHLAFTWVLRICTRGLVLAGQALYPPPTLMIWFLVLCLAWVRGMAVSPLVSCCFNNCECHGQEWTRNLLGPRPAKLFLQFSSENSISFLSVVVLHLI